MHWSSKLFSREEKTSWKGPGRKKFLRGKFEQKISTLHSDNFSNGPSLENREHLKYFRNVCRVMTNHIAAQDMQAKHNTASA